MPRCVQYKHNRTCGSYEFSGGVLTKYALVVRVSLMNLGFNLGVVCPMRDWVPQ